MEKEELDIETIKRYWIAEAEEGLTVADHLFEKRDYSYALFFGHLAMEKLLKADIVTHNIDDFKSFQEINIHSI